MSTAHSRSPIQSQNPEPLASTPRNRAARINEARALSEIIDDQFQSLATHVVIVLETGDADGIHKLRVATRKLQAALDLLQSGPDELHVRRLKNKLRKLRGVLSKARNYDVFEQLVQTEATHSGPVRRKQHEWILLELQKRRTNYLTYVRAHLEKFPITQLAETLQIKLDPGPAEDSGVSRVQSFPVSRIAQRAADRLEQRTVEFQKLAAEVHPGSSPVKVHQLRIAAKRLRYLAEVLSQMGYPKTNRVVAWLKRVQDRLGDWHDLHSLEEEVIHIVIREEFLREHMRRGGGILQAGAHLLRRKNAILQKNLPLRLPHNLGSYSKRLLKTLRRRAADRPFLTAIK